MTKRLLIAIFAALIIHMCLRSAFAQGSGPQTCRGPIYTREQVGKSAKLIDQPNFKALFEALGNDISARVKLDAVLCRSGRVTDIHVLSSQPPGAGEFVAAAVSLMRFKPAETNWHTVSQRQHFEFSINASENSKIVSTAALGRLVEELEIVGNRRLTMDQIVGWIRTRAGETYNPDQVQKDLLAIIATGAFDARGTRVTLEDGVRGGVRVIFEVVELPLIREIRIEGLKADDESAVLKELIRQRVNLVVERPLDLAGLKKATNVVEQFLQAQGWTNPKSGSVYRKYQRDTSEDNSKDRRT